MGYCGILLRVTAEGDLVQREVKLLMGNEAIALGAIRAGVRVVAGYPGTPSTEILETIAKEIALSILDVFR
jgi:TPP-dependent indolepyruvate ferredoxin oxidoreductase alpha subunit